MEVIAYGSTSIFFHISNVHNREKGLQQHHDVWCCYSLVDFFFKFQGIGFWQDLDLTGKEKVEDNKELPKEKLGRSHGQQTHTTNYTNTSFAEETNGCAKNFK